MTTQLVSDAFKMAVRQQRPLTGRLHHSDRGSRYTGTAYQGLLKDNHCRVNISGTGNCYDNVSAESFFGSLKMELAHHIFYETRAQARTDIFFYIEAFYNRQRRHSALGYVSPVAHEAAYYQHQLALT